MKALMLAALLAVLSSSALAGGIVKCYTSPLTGAVTCNGDRGVTKCFTSPLTGAVTCS